MVGKELEQYILTDQNSVPGNSGDGSSNTDDNGNMYTE